MRTLVIVAAGSLFSSCLVFAQSNVKTCQEVHAYVSVMNSKGQVVSGLDASNFAAEIGGVPAKIQNVEHSPTQHRAILLVDHSGSMGGVRWAATRDITMTFVRLLPPSIPIS